MALSLKSLANSIVFFLLNVTGAIGTTIGPYAEPFKRFLLNLPTVGPFLTATIGWVPATSILYGAFFIFLFIFLSGIFSIFGALKAIIIGLIIGGIVVFILYGGSIPFLGNATNWPPTNSTGVG